MRKLLVSVLVAAVVGAFGLLALGATGDLTRAFTDIAGHRAEAELTLMAALGIFAGERGVTGPAKPDDFITRAQFCKVVVLAAGKGATAAGLGGLRPEFADEIPTWAWGYVNTAYYLGIIGGYPDRTFRPDKPVTYAEALTMLVKAVPGHGAMVPPGVWPYNYLFYAVDNGFAGDVDCIPNLPCTRADMARLLYHTMQVQWLDAKGNPLYHDAPTNKLPKAWLAKGTNLFRGVLTGYTSSTIQIEGLADDLDLGDPVYAVGGSRYDDFLGLDVIAVTKAGKVVFLWKTEGTSVGGVFDKLWADPGTGRTYILLKGGKRVQYSSDFSVVLNHKQGFGKGDLMEGDEVTINTNDKGIATTVFGRRWDLVCLRTGSGPDYTYVHDKADIVTKVEKSKTVGTTQHNTKLTVGKGKLYYKDLGAGWRVLDDTVLEIPRTAKVTVNGAAADRDDLAAFDVVKLATYGAEGYDPGSVIAVAAWRTVAEGVVTSYRTYTGYTAVTLKAGEKSSTYVVDATYLSGPPTIGNLYRYGLGPDGRLFYDIGHSTTSPVVLITDHETEVTSSGTRTYVIVDHRGNTERYEYVVTEVGEDLSDNVGEFAVLVVSGATGRLSDVILEGEFAVEDHVRVLAVGPDCVTLSGARTYFAQEPVVVYSYDGDADEYTYTGLGGLEAGDEVTYMHYENAGTTWTVLVRDDTP